MKSEQNVTILSGVGYRNRQPFLEFTHNGQQIELTSPYDLKNYSLQNDVRFCVGWRDIENKTRHVCPESSEVNPKYDTCPACQKRTGFNPAFYHATTISPQQEKRNAQPHTVYLANFAPNVTKVGIAHTPRIYDRLLEQGARGAAILESAPTALVARSHEAKIAKLADVRESVQANIKLRLVIKKFDATLAEQELKNQLSAIDKNLGFKFNQAEFINLNSFYFPSASQPDLHTSTNITAEAKIIGKPIGMIGSILILNYNDRLVHINLKRYVGYRLNPHTTTADFDLAPEQTSLF